MSGTASRCVSGLSLLLLSLLPIAALGFQWDAATLHRGLVSGSVGFALLLLGRSISPDPLRRGGGLWALASSALIGLAFLELSRTQTEHWAAGVASSFPGDPRMMVRWGGTTAVFLLGGYLLSRWLAPRSDALLWVIVSFLIGLGLVMLHRLGPAEAALRGKPFFQQLARRQFLWLGLSVGVYLGILRWASSRTLLHLSRGKYIYIWFAVGLILVTSLWGREINARRLWIGIGPVTLQSVELVKLLVLLFIASYFSERHYVHIRHLGPFHVPRIQMMGPYVLVWGLAVLPVFLQGDLGPTFLLFAVFLAMFYVGSTTRVPLVIGVLLVVGVGVVCYVWGKPPIVRTRVDMWLHPFASSESMTQALWAMSAGGIFGQGIGAGMPERIPVVHSDFSIAAIAEEMGLLGALALLLAYAALFTRAYQIATRCEDRFHGMLAAGILSLLGMQTLIILAGATQLLPLTGITLPFVSYGGSSMLVNLTMMALLTKLSERNGEGSP